MPIPKPTRKPVGRPKAERVLTDDEHENSPAGPGDQKAASNWRYEAGSSRPVVADSRNFTPTSSSWLNQVERFFAEIAARQIRRDAFRSVPAFERAIHEYLDHHNENSKPFAWTADADLILNREKRVCERLSDLGQ